MCVCGCVYIHIHTHTHMHICIHEHTHTHTVHIYALTRRETKARCETVSERKCQSAVFEDDDDSVYSLF